MSVWFLTGASRGLGLEIARQLLERGESVAATARDPRAVAAALPGHGDRLAALALDVTDARQASGAVEAALDRFGRIDVLVNNAGRGLLGAVEEASAEEVHAVFETNVHGLLNVTRAVLPVLRAQRSGTVVNLSSVLGFSAKPGWGVYAATKFAVEGLSEALRVELEPVGVRVTLVEPGLFRTDFLDQSSLRFAAEVIADYAPTAGRVRNWAAGHNHQQAGDPVKAAAAIIDLALLADPPQRLALGTDSVERIGAKLDDAYAELAAWRSLGLSMSYDADSDADADTAVPVLFATAG
jgi:NAD(P)-dependent dehydrogenase (short-subunit alcohol dehydrogenase family)